MLATDSSNTTTTHFEEAVRSAETNLTLEAWRLAIDALATALRPIDGVVVEDYEAMRDEPDDELLLWVEDLQDRVGLDVDLFRARINTYLRLRGGSYTFSEVAGLLRDAPLARDGAQ